MPLLDECQGCGATVDHPDSWWCATCRSRAIGYEFLQELREELDRDAGIAGFDDRAWGLVLEDEELRLEVLDGSCSSGLRVQRLGGGASTL